MGFQVIIVLGLVEITNINTDLKMSGGARELVTDATQPHFRLIKLYPGFQTYNYEKVNNEMLAKAEIPFLVYERNRDKCFIYITD